MAKPIENIVVAKQFLEKLANAAAITAEAQTALRNLLNAGTPVTAEQVITLLNAALGGTAWQTWPSAAAITTELDAYFSSTAWRMWPSATDIVDAINGFFGSTTWQGGGGGGGGGGGVAFRPYAHNKYYEINSYWYYDSYTLAVTGPAGMGSHGGIPDGYTTLDLQSSSANILPAVDPAFDLFPISLNLITVQSYVSARYQEFKGIIEAIAASPNLLADVAPRVFDFSTTVDMYDSVDMLPRGFFPPTIQTTVDQMLDSGWTFSFPYGNLPDVPWVSFGYIEWPSVYTDPVYSVCWTVQAGVLYTNSTNDPDLMTWEAVGTPPAFPRRAMVISSMHTGAELYYTSYPTGVAVILNPYLL